MYKEVPVNYIIIKEELNTTDEKLKSNYF